MADTLIVTSKVKAYLKSKHNIRASSEFLGELDGLVERVCDNAAAAATKDKRSTVKGRDVALSALPAPATATTSSAEGTPPQSS